MRPQPAGGKAERATEKQWKKKSRVQARARRLPERRVALRGGGLGVGVSRADSRAPLSSVQSTLEFHRKLREKRTARAGFERLAPARAGGAEGI